MKARKVCLYTLLSLLLCAPAFAGIIYVTPTGPGPDGLSWATAFSTIQADTDGDGMGGAIFASCNSPVKVLVPQGIDMPDLGELAVVTGISCIVYLQQ